MRLLLLLITVAAAGWAGYWFVGSSQKQSDMSSWFDARRDAGWAADYTTMQVRGFPNRFDTLFEDIRLADPATGWAWEAGYFQLNQLSYGAGHVIAVWPPRQRIATPLAKYDLASRDMRASVVFADAGHMLLDRLTLTAENMTIAQGDGAGSTGLSALTLAAERLPGPEHTYRLGLRADDLTPSLPWKAVVDPAGTLPDTLSALSADMTVRFDQPWDHNAIERARPQPTHIKLRLAEARWGKLELQAAGALDIGADGIPRGDITLKARNWREIMELAVAAEFLPESIAGPVTEGLALVAQLAGHPKTLDIPLRFSGGRISLGPVPIAPAPKLYLR